MRIAVLVTYFPILSETFVLNQVTGLIDRGHDVDIYAQQPGDLSQLHQDVETYRLLERTHYIPAVPSNVILQILKGLVLFVTHVHKAPRVVLRSLNFFKYGKRAASFWLLYLAIPHLNQKPYDIIHAQFGTDGIKGMQLREIGAIQGKLVTIFRGYDISHYVQHFGADYYKTLFQSGDFFLANCEFFRHKAIQIGCDPDQIAVHYSGLDCDRFKFKVRQLALNQPIRIATVGRLVEKKGIEYSIRAVAQVAKAYPNLEYHIIGDGPLKEHLQALIERLGMSQQIRLVGAKNQHDIIASLDQAHIFVAPSITAKDGNQDAPINVLKEAMAMGLPVISTHHGGIPELVIDGVSGLLVQERDADAIATALQTLLEQPDRWASMGRSGRAYVEAHYNLHSLNDRLVQIYQQLLTPIDHQPEEQTMALSNPDAQVTIVVVPRERFSCARESLESIYQYTDRPFNLVYVDGNSPTDVHQYLQEKAREKQFRLIRTNYYLYPNQARNIGLADVKTPYTVFVDNDVIVSPGWLDALVQCAEETQAAVVGPLMCQNEPVHEIVHFAGGESHVWVDNLGRRRLREKMYKQGQSVAQLRPQLQRQKTELAEFHCVLVRTEIFDRIGLLDQAMCNTKEHLDFCMSVAQAGGEIYFEPRSLVTYVPGPPLKLSDLHYYMLRWSDRWTLTSLNRLREKWDLAEDGYFQAKYKKLNWRRYGTIIEPLSRRLTFGLGSTLLARALARLEHPLNHYLTNRHAQRQAQQQMPQPSPTLPSASITEPVSSNR